MKNKAIVIYTFETGIDANADKNIPPYCERIQKLANQILEGVGTCEVKEIDGFYLVEVEAKGIKQELKAEINSKEELAILHTLGQLFNKKIVFGFNGLDLTLRIV